MLDCDMEISKEDNLFIKYNKVNPLTIMTISRAASSSINGLWSRLSN